MESHDAIGFPSSSSVKSDDQGARGRLRCRCAENGAAQGTRPRKRGRRPWWQLSAPREDLRSHCVLLRHEVILWGVLGGGIPIRVSDLLSRTEWRATRSPTCSWSDRGRASDRARRLRVREPGLPSPAGRRHRPRHLQGPAANTSLHGATDLKSGMGCAVTLSSASRMRSSFATVVVENAREPKRRAASTPRMIPVFMSSAP